MLLSSTSAAGNRSRLPWRLTVGSDGRRFQRSSQGHAAQGRQWSMSSRLSVSFRPVQTQNTELVDCH